MCILFSAHVSDWWDGNTNNPNIYDTCFSSWYLPHDLTPSIVETNAISVFKSSRATNLATIGYYCALHEFCFASNAEDNPWWTADLGDFRKVSKIILIAANHPGHASFFNDVVVTLGNNTNYENNPTFGTYAGSAPITGAIVTLTPPTSITGRYLKIQSHILNNLFVICDILIN